MIWLYNAALLLFVPLLLPVWVVLLGARPRLRSGFGERWIPLAPSDRAPVWLHAASVGEVEAATALVHALLERGVPVLVTVMTTEGRERLRERVPGLPVRLAPLDLPGLVHLSLARARPAVLVLVETELWPNLIHAAAGRGTRVIVVSGRISDGSLRAYRRLRPLYAPLLASLTRVCARSREDRERFISLGVPAERVRVGGDLKLDRRPPAEPSEELRRALGSGPLLVGGSTHPGEEEALLAAWQKLRSSCPGLRLVIAPRHPERVPQIRSSLEALGVSAGLRSQGAAAFEVAIVDTLGELATIYRLADLVFAGGTLAPVGGHNLLEPVQAGKVAVHGPHTENQRSLERLLAPLGALVRVGSSAELAPELQRLWADPERHERARRAKQALERHRGAVERALDLIVQLREGPAVA